VNVTVLHATDERAQRRADEEVIRAFSDRLAGLDVAFREVAGDPAEQIIEYTRSHPTDLIVMPIRGGGALRKLLRGSVTDKVLRGANCPVWTGVTIGRALPRQTRIAKVACAVDLGPTTADVLQWASDFARSQGARLTVIHASSQLVPRIGVVHDPEWREHVARVMRKELAEVAASAGSKAEIMLVPGEPDAAVSAAAERSSADVLVIGRTPGGFSRWFGSNADGIIRQARCAVISVGSMAPRGETETRLPDAVSQPDQRYEEEIVATTAGLR
jgi:nucleotide-binding universal stress UspA family protein